MFHYPFHPGDYLLDTAHLTPEQDLAYRRLLDLYYTSEAPIPLETQRVATRLRLDNRVVSEVLEEFFLKGEKGWHQSRCDAEIAAYHAMAARNRANGSLGGRPKKNPKKPTGNPLGTQRDATGNPTGNRELEPISNTDRQPRVRATLQQAIAAAGQTGVTEAEADAWWHTREASDWMKGTGGGGTTPVGQNWQADMKTFTVGMRDQKKRKETEDAKRTPTTYRRATDNLNKPGRYA